MKPGKNSVVTLDWSTYRLSRKRVWRWVGKKRHWPSILPTTLSLLYQSTKQHFPQNLSAQKQWNHKTTQTQHRTSGKSRTGHDHRNRQNTLLEGTDTGISRICNTELETPSHIILNCRRLLQTRTEIFRNYDADTIVQSWDVESLTSFLTVEHTVAMEQGD